MFCNVLIASPVCLTERCVGPGRHPLGRGGRGAEVGAAGGGLGRLERRVGARQAGAAGQTLGSGAWQAISQQAV